MTHNRKLLYLALVVVSGIFMFSKTFRPEYILPSHPGKSTLLPTPHPRDGPYDVKPKNQKPNPNPRSAQTKPEPKPVDRKRIAIIAYIPTQPYVYQFLTMLYGSWRYITNHRFLLLQNETQVDMSPIIDIHAYCHPSVCKLLSKFCQPYPIDISDPAGPRTIKNTSNYAPIVANSPDTCWRFFEPRTGGYGYDYINAYIMFNRPDISEIGLPYDKFMRSDLDCFLTPQFLVWKPLYHMVVGNGGYCVPFNEARLKEIAKKLNLTHRGVHCVGSTWFGDVQTFIEAAKLTLVMTEHFYKKEFDPKLPGLEKINFTHSPYGVWPEWWKLVSSMYGGELAMNHLIDGFNVSFKAPLDGLSTSNDSVWSVPHIHCWHGNTEFNKFTYFTIAEQVFHAAGAVPAAKVREIVSHARFENARSMSLRGYAEYIAWNSFLKYLQDFFVPKPSF